jgi:hypothetical protein
MAVMVSGLAVAPGTLGSSSMEWASKSSIKQKVSKNKFAFGLLHHEHWAHHPYSVGFKVSHQTKGQRTHWHFPYKALKIPSSLVVIFSSFMQGGDCSQE